ncbi:three-Cys-motif partner protein TcmP [Candidatus Aenigmatarchaeota archaeon]
MSPRKMTDREWIISHLKPLMDKGKEINTLDGEIESKVPTYDKGYWTALKLICIKYYIPPFVNIFRKRGKKTAFIDLFSGPGINILGDAKIPVLGSPLIPLVIDREKPGFDYHIFCDNKKKNVDALEARIDAYKLLKSDKFSIEKKDANKLINEIPEILKSFGIDHSLIFIDPEGMEMKWDSVTSMADNIMCDFIINFPSTAISRNLHYPDAIKSFLGPGSEKVPSSHVETWAIKQYRKNLAGIGKDVSTEIAIRAGGGIPYHYHLIPAVRKTFAASPWFPNIFGGLNYRIKKFSGKVLEEIASQIEGRSKSLVDMI